MASRDHPLSRRRGWIVAVARGHGSGVDAQEKLVVVLSNDDFAGTSTLQVAPLVVGYRKVAPSVVHLEEPGPEVPADSTVLVHLSRCIEAEYVTRAVEQVTPHDMALVDEAIDYVFGRERP